MPKNNDDTKRVIKEARARVDGVASDAVTEYAIAVGKAAGVELGAIESAKILTEMAGKGMLNAAGVRKKSGAEKEPDRLKKVFEESEYKGVVGALRVAARVTGKVPPEGNQRNTRGSKPGGITI
jgi:hypothetical protein